MTKKKIFTIAGIAAGVVIVIGIVIWLVFFRSGSSAPTDPNEMVYVTSVADITGTGSLGMTAKYSGVVEPEKTLSVQKDDTKKIAELYVTVGQEVKVGDKLFSYDTEDIQMQLEEAQLQLESFKNRVSTLNQQIDSLQKEKNNASSDEQLSYTLQIQSAQLEVKSTEYDQSTKAKEIENLKKSLENTDVTAEMAGVIKQINDGSNANNSGSGDSSSNAYITILATGSYRVKGTATELNVYALQDGMKMKVISRVDPEQTWTGTVESIEREAASDNSSNGISYGTENSFTKATKYNFYLVLDDFNGLMLGQHVYVEPDESENVKTGIWLPSYYILNEGSKNYVWAVNDKNRIEKREVQLGNFDDTLSEYEIKSGVTEDDRLAVAEDRVHSGMYATDDISYLNQGDDSADANTADGDVNGGKIDDANGAVPAEDGSNMDGDPNGYNTGDSGTTDSTVVGGGATEGDSAAADATDSDKIEAEKNSEASYANDGAAANFETAIGGATA